MELGMVGLGRMGANLVRRVNGAAHCCVVFDADPDAVTTLESEDVIGASSLAELVTRLAPSRAVWVMVRSGEFMGKVITDLAEHLEPGNTIIDGGNSYYRDDIAPAQNCSSQGHPPRRRRHERGRGNLNGATAL